MQTRFLGSLTAQTLAIALLPRATAFAAPLTPAQMSEADIELASGKFVQCRLTTEAKFSTNLDAAKRAEALGRYSDKLPRAFSTATIRYALNCAAEPVSAFDAHPTQCSDDIVAAAAGARCPITAVTLRRATRASLPRRAARTAAQESLATCESNLQAL